MSVGYLQQRVSWKEGHTGNLAEDIKCCNSLEVFKEKLRGKIHMVLKHYCQLRVKNKTNWPQTRSDFCMRG